MTETRPNVYARLLLAIRVQQGWTQRELGDAIGVSERTIVRWESAQTQPHWRTTGRIRALLKDEEQAA